jgi:hypothetical protein
MAKLMATTITTGPGEWTRGDAIVRAEDVM